MIYKNEIARICHEANRALCEAFGDKSQAPWADAPNWQHDAAMTQVDFHINNPDAGPEATHESWAAEKRADGWVHGPVKDGRLKTHPCLVPFSELPQWQQAKDYIFKAIVRAAAGSV